MKGEVISMTPGLSTVQVVAALGFRSHDRPRKGHGQAIASKALFLHVLILEVVMDLELS